MRKAERENRTGNRFGKVQLVALSRAIETSALPPHRLLNILEDGLNRASKLNLHTCLASSSCFGLLWR